MGFGLSEPSRMRRSGSGSVFRKGLKDDDDESGVADVSSAACKENIHGKHVWKWESVQTAKFSQLNLAGCFYNKHTKCAVNVYTTFITVK